MTISEKTKFWLQLGLSLVLILPLWGRPYKGGELRTYESYTFGRFEVRMRSAEASGMLSSFFTYHDDDPNWQENWNEIDIEIMGRYDDQVQFNVITPWQINHVHEEMVDYNPHEEFHVYAIEWTPIWVAWFIDDVEVYRDMGDHVWQVNLPQKIMMNIWPPTAEDWAGPFNADDLPIYAFYDWVKYYSYTPGSGEYGTANLFSFEWEDNFDFWDQSRWGKATHTFDGNNCDFIHANVEFLGGYMILCLTDNVNLGFNGELPEDNTAFLHTDGSDIVGPDGEPFLLRGLGLGGWLVPEGYMLHMPGFGSPTVIHDMIEDVVGINGTITFYQVYEANYVNDADIDLIADWGFNHIRLPFHYNKISPEPGIYLEAGLAQLDSTLAWCARNEMYLILDMHCAPGGQNDGNISDSNGEALLWSTPAHQAHTVEIWQMLAERYANEQWIGGYDLINEPVLPEGYTNADLRQLYIEIRDAIRTVDTNHILFIEGNTYATDFNLLTPPFDDNMVYAFHKYWSGVNTGSIQSMLTIRNQYNVPLWLGESGENSNHWYASTIDLMEDNNIGWNWWTHKKLDTITSPLSADIPPLFQDLIDYWDGNGPAPIPEVAQVAVLQMANNLALGNCRFRPDVLAAITDPEFILTPKPFGDHYLPGSIAAVDYDLGANGVGYSDTEYWWDDYNSYTAWNSGHVYRNDGVDIEASSGNSGTEYNVGWTSPGEWMHYTVEVGSAGYYRADLIYSGQETGLVQLLLDGAPVGSPMGLVSTGGWQNWQTQSQSSLFFLPGEHILRLLTVTGGFNLARLDFLLEDPAVLGDITGDGVLDILDIVQLVEMILGDVEPTPVQLWAGDLSDDGTLDILDVVQMVFAILDVGRQ